MRVGVRLRPDAAPGGEGAGCRPPVGGQARLPRRLCVIVTLPASSARSTLTGGAALSYTTHLLRSFGEAFRRVLARKECRIGKDGEANGTLLIPHRCLLTVMLLYPVCHLSLRVTGALEPLRRA